MDGILERNHTLEIKFHIQIEHHLMKAGDYMMKVGFIGAGKVGSSLGHYFFQNKIPISGFYSRTQSSGWVAAKQCNTQNISCINELIMLSDVLFLTVPDDQISAVWEQMKQFPIQGKYICHCSGSLTSNILSGIKAAEAFGYSIHPIFPFQSKTTAYEVLNQAIFTIEGDEMHQAPLLELLHACPNRFIPIQAEQKVRYHAAAVFASNFVVSLFHQSFSILMDCGFEEEEARMALRPLAFANLNHIFEVGPKKALTGPVERHDLDTVKKHLNALSPEERKIYTVLTQDLITIACQRHPERCYADLKSILEETNL